MGLKFHSCRVVFLDLLQIACLLYPTKTARLRTRGVSERAKFAGEEK